MHRENVAGITHINHFKFQENKVYSKDEPDFIMTNVIGVDANSLYPSVGASIKSKWNNYTDNTMYMLGRFLRREINYEDMERIVKAKSDKEVFFVSVKCHFPLQKYNKLINFPQIIRPYYLENDYDHFLDTDNLAIIRKDKQRKLT
jgi:hypothetical protein